MNPLALSLAYLKDRALNTALNVLLLALGVATAVILILFSTQLEQRFTRDAEGIDLVVGAKGSPLQLILSSVYHVDVPTGNVPLDTAALVRRDPFVGKVIPLALGDNFRGFRIVGTEATYPEHYGATVAQGRLWDKPMEATLGSEVARATGATLGQKFTGSHGLLAEAGGHSHDYAPFTTVGILAPTGTVLDRLILVSVESVWNVHGISHEEDHDHAGHDHGDAGHKGEDSEGHDHAGHDHGGHDHGGHDDHAGHDHDDKPELIGARKTQLEPELTGLLVSYRSPAAAMRVPAFVNAQAKLQAAVPAIEITRLLELLGVGLDAVRAFAGLLLATAGLSIFVALYGALRQREGDMAMLRVMGASRGAIFAQIVTEGLLMAAAGAALGLALGHVVVEIAARSFPELTAMGLTGARFANAELWVVVAALGIGVLAAALPALRVFRVDLAKTLAEAR
jgi:putative ABC transport system permease protein